jgi:hypothetical protein
MAYKGANRYPIFVGFGDRAVPQRAHALLADVAVVDGGSAAVATAEMHAPVRAVLILQTHCHDFRISEAKE